MTPERVREISEQIYKLSSPIAIERAITQAVNEAISEIEGWADRNDSNDYGDYAAGWSCAMSRVIEQVRTLKLPEEP